MRVSLLVFPAVFLLCGCTPSPHLTSSGATPAKPVERSRPSGGYVTSFGSEKHDSLENDPRYRRAFQEAEIKTERKLAGVQRGRGFVHLYRETKKQILLKDYGLDWKTPAELNPNISYD